MFDDDLPKKKAPAEFPRNLERLSLGELAAYIEELEQEIARVRKDMDRKKSSQDAASTLFR